MNVIPMKLRVWRSNTTEEKENIEMEKNNLNDDMRDLRLWEGQEMKNQRYTICAENTRESEGKMKMNTMRKCTPEERDLRVEGWVKRETREIKGTMLDRPKERNKYMRPKEDWQTAAD